MINTAAVYFNLMDHLVYIFIRTPIKLVTIFCSNTVSAMRSYTRNTPLLRMFDYILYSLNVRIHNFNTIFDKFIKESMLFFSEIANFIALSFLTITAVVVNTIEKCSLQLNHAHNFYNKALILPSTLFKGLYQASCNKENIKLKKEVVIRVMLQVKNYTLSTCHLLFTACLIIIPCVGKEQRRKFTFATNAENYRANYFMRSIFFLCSVSTLIVLISYADQLINDVMTRSTHFICIAVGSTIMTAILLAPAKKASTYVVIRAIVAYLICYFACPSIFELN